MSKKKKQGRRKGGRIRQIEERGMSERRILGCRLNRLMVLDNDMAGRVTAGVWISDGVCQSKEKRCVSQSVYQQRQSLLLWHLDDTHLSLDQTATQANCFNCVWPYVEGLADAIRTSEKWKNGRKQTETKYAQIQKPTAEQNVQLLKEQSGIFQPNLYPLHL